MKLQFIFLLLLIYYSSTYADESGWIDKGNYKYEKLTFNNLFRVSFSDDYNYFYTFHRDRIIRKWDLMSGVLLDSMIIERIPDLFYFSQDRKTCVFTYFLDNIYYQAINIIDLETKEVIAKDSMHIFIYFCPEKNFSCFSSDFLLDYSTDNNLLYAGLFYHLGGTYGGGSLVYRHDGFLGSFDVHKDTLIPFKQIACVGIKYFTYLNNDIYFSYDIDAELQYPGKPTLYSTEYGIMKYSRNDDKVDKLLNYQTDHLEKSYLKITDLYIYPKYKLLLFKSNEKFHFFDLESNLVITGRSILSKSNAHCAVAERNLLVTSEKDILYFYQLDKTSFSYYQLPITPDRLLSVGNYILAYNNYQGQIILINIDNINSINDKIHNTDMEMYPNPVQDILYIKNNSEGTLNYKIYNLYGQEVLKGETYDGTINTFILLNGIYYLRYKNINKQFIILR